MAHQFDLFERFCQYIRFDFWNFREDYLQSKADLGKKLQKNKILDRKNLKRRSKEEINLGANRFY